MLTLINLLFEEFRSLQLPERKIDLSFIQHFYLTSDSTSRQFVTKGIGGSYIIPIHYHFTTPAIDSLLITQNYPDAILFKEELQTWHMPTKNDEISTLGEYYSISLHLAIQLLFLLLVLFLYLIAWNPI